MNIFKIRPSFFSYFVFMIMVLSRPFACGDVVESGKFTGRRTLTFGIAMESQFSSAWEVEKALTIIAAAAPPGVTILPARDEDLKKGRFDFMVDVVDSKYSKYTFESGLALHHSNLESNPGAYTYLADGNSKGPYVVGLVWDVLALEERGGKSVERRDAQARIITALAHEVYGSVWALVAQKNFLPSMLRYEGLSLLEKAELEVLAFERGLAAMKHVKELSGALDMNAESRMHVSAAVVREEQGLATWRKNKADLEQTVIHAPALVEASKRAPVLSLPGRCERLFRPTKP